MYRVWGDTLSGNCYKIKLLLEFLGTPYEWHHVDILAEESHTKEFLAMNPNGKIPVLQIDSHQCLSESNAILNYLAEGSSFLPESGLPRAKVLQWQFFEQYSHEPYIAVARYINLYLGMPSERIAEYQSKQAGGHKALQVMEQQLEQARFLTGNIPTIADVSLFAYTHVAHEGGFNLENYPAVIDWLTRIREIPGYVEMAAENAS